MEVLAGGHVSIAVVGSASVGKTSIVTWQTRRDTSKAKKVEVAGSSGGAPTTLSRPSDGIFFRRRRHIMNGRQYTVTMWDASSSEMHFYATTRYVAAAHGVAYVFDGQSQSNHHTPAVTSRASLVRLERWMEFVEMNRDVQRILIGNKADLPSNRQVTRDEANEYAQRNGMRYFEASAATGQGIAEAFNSLLYHVVVTEGVSIKEQTVDRQLKSKKNLHLASTPDWL